MKKTRIVLILAFFSLAVRAGAQAEAPYLTEATFIISVDDWADISINGKPIIDSQPYTSDSTGPQTITAVPKSLCDFRRENILAIEVADKSVGVTIGQDSVGISYILRLRSSDGRVFLLTSDDAADHKAFYIPNRMAGSPRGWQEMTFDDSSWLPAYSTGPSIPYAAQVIDPRTQLPVSFLSAASDSSKSRYAGERHLFRRKFFLNIGNNPNCGQPSKPPRMEPVMVEQPENRRPVSPPIATPTGTPTAVAAIRPPYPPVPLEWETQTGAPLERAPEIPIAAAERAGNGISSRAESREAVSTAPPVSAAVPLVRGAAGQTLIFDRLPANIYMSFADGPGIYSLEVLDKDGHHVRNLYAKKIVAQSEDWAEWDGKDDMGRTCPRGWYYVIFAKNGKTLKRILAGKTFTDSF